MRILPIILLITHVLMTGCTKYQFGTIASNMKENSSNEHILENDTLLIKYKFHGQNCPVIISVENKLDVPLYVDWKRSAVILKDQTYSYWTDKAIIRGASGGTEVQWAPVVSSSHATFRGEIVRSEAVSFMPPRSLKEVSMISIQKDLFPLPGKKSDHTEELAIDNEAVFGLHYDFFKEESPLVYRSFLTFSTSPSFSESFSYENEFWVSELFQTAARPEKYFRAKENVNKFYTSKTTGLGTFMGVTGAILTAVLLSQ